MAKKKHSKPERMGRLYIVHPTLDVLLSSCKNVKMAADISGIEYSNFLKSCKLEKDLRTSTYQKCATGFKKDVLIVHLPCGLIESIVSVKPHLSNRCYCIEQEDLILILYQLFRGRKTPPAFYFDLFWSRVMEQADEPLMRQFLSAMLELCKNLLKENGTTV